MFWPWRQITTDGPFPPNLLKLLEERAGASGNSELWELLGAIFESAEQPWKAVIWYRKAVEGGQLYLARFLANFYFYNFSPPRVDDAIAIARNYMEPDAASAYLFDLRSENTLIPSHDEMLKTAIEDLDTEAIQ